MGKQPLDPLCPADSALSFVRITLCFHLTRRKKYIHSCIRLDIGMDQTGKSYWTVTWIRCNRRG